MPHFLAQKTTNQAKISQECTLLRSTYALSATSAAKNKSFATTSLTAPLATTQNLKIYPKLQSLKSQNLALIPVKFDKNIFFLQEIVRSNDLLINGLKITRHTPVATLKTALEVISQDYEVISHNLNPHNLHNQNLRHSSLDTLQTSRANHSLDFLLSPKELLERVFGAFEIGIDFATPKSKPDKATAKTTTKIPTNPAKSPKIFLEIGFGSGRHILHLAKQNPNDIFIGLEVHTPSIEQVLKNIAISHLQNLFILHFDARVLLEILPSNSLDCIFLHFPVPWNDSPSRRVFSEHFLALALRVLKKGGILELKTDDKIYFKDALSISKNHQNQAKPQKQSAPQSTQKVTRKIPQKMMIQSSIQTPQDFAKNDFANSSDTNATTTRNDNPKSSQKSNTIDSTQALSSQIISKYQARWLRQNKDIFTLKVQSLRKNRPILLKSHFLFDKNLVKSTLTKQPKLSSLINHRQVFANGFLHISDIFASQKSKDFARLAFIVRMGDFAQPMSCVVVFEMCDKQVDSYYLKEPPLPTKATTEAHKRFIALLEKL